MIDRDEKSTIRIVCSEALKQHYYDSLGVKLFFAMTVILPFGQLAMVAFFIKLHRRRIELKCMKPSNHGKLAGMILTGVLVNAYIIAMDIVALANIYNNSHEFREYDILESFNFYIVVITATLDFLATIYSISAWLLFVGWTCTYKNCQCHSQAKLTSCFRNMLKCLFVPYLYLVFGYKKHDKFWKEEDNQTSREEQREVLENIFAIRQLWALLSLMIGPLFGTFSHICYISVAWLTEPHKTSSILVLFIAVLVYLFYLFKALYKSSESYSMPFAVRNKRIFQHAMRYFESFFHCCMICSANYNCGCIRDIESIDIGEEFVNDHQLLVRNENSKSNFHSNANLVIFSKAKLLSTFITGIIGAIPLTLTILGFTYIPIPSLELADYLRNVIQIGLIIFATLATHRIFSLKEPSLSILMRKFKSSYETQRVPDNKQLSDDIFEACGEIAGEVCQTLHRRNDHNVMHNPMDENIESLAARSTTEEPVVAITSL